MFTPEEIAAGQAVYTPRILANYDLIVLTVSNRWIWRCPTRRLLRQYNECVTPNHLDVGVGSGYFLDRCRFATPQPRVALMDLNPNALRYAARRIARYSPETYRCNVLEPIDWTGRNFDSIGINYLLHCLPGSIEAKAVALDHLIPLMNPNGILFGSTLLHGGVRRNGVATRLMEYYNRQRIFSNLDDDLSGLTAALQGRLVDVRIEVVGCAALFVGRV